MIFISVLSNSRSTDKRLVRRPNKKNVRFGDVETKRESFLSTSHLTLPALMHLMDPLEYSKSRNLNFYLKTNKQINKIHHLRARGDLYKQNKREGVEADDTLRTFSFAPFFLFFKIWTSKPLALTLISFPTLLAHDLV